MYFPNFLSWRVIERIICVFRVEFVKQYFPSVFRQYGLFFLGNMNFVDISIRAFLFLKFLFWDDFDFLLLFFIIVSSVSGKYIVLLLNNLIFV